MRGPDDLRRMAPVLSALADRIGERVFAGGVNKADKPRKLSVATWMVIMQLLSSLLTAFQVRCGNVDKPADAAAWLRDRSQASCRRIRLRRAIAERWVGSISERRALTAAIEAECDRMTATIIGPAMMESGMVV